MVASNAIGAVAQGPDVIPYRQRAPAAVAAVSSEITVYRRIQLVGRVQYLQPVDGTAWLKIFVDNAVHVPLTDMLSLDFRAYNPPNVIRPGALTIRDFKISTGLGLSF
jgi:hypothetical protein